MANSLDLLDAGDDPAAAAVDRFGQMPDFLEGRSGGFGVLAVFLVFHLADHAGEDIVCSAVSALTLATLNGLLEVVKAQVDYQVEEGYTKFEVYQNNDSIKVLMDTYELGIRAMLEDYGQFVRLVKKEVQPHDQD